jgi:hypothetical protein
VDSSPITELNRVPFFSVPIYTLSQFPPGRVSRILR